MVLVKKDYGTLIAVYGGLRKDGDLFAEIDTEYVKYKGIYITKPKYTMYNIGDLYPGVIPGGNTPITLDVFNVNMIQYEDVIDEVMGYDILEEETSLFNKHVINTPYGMAFIYYYNRKIKEERIVESGDWKYETSPFNKNTQMEYERIKKLQTTH